MSACTPQNDIAVPALSNLFINAKYFIDSRFGNDSTAIFYDVARPYRTLGAVLALVQPNEVVFVQPGTYSAPVTNLNNAVWYFSAGATTTTQITGDGSVFGFGQFIGQSPAISFSGTELYFQASSVTTPTGYAIYANSGYARFDISKIDSNGGAFHIDGPAHLDININDYDGTGIFIFLSALATGELFCQCLELECGNGIVSQSNDYTVNLNSIRVDVTGDYFIRASDATSNPSSLFRANVNVNKITCSGLINVSGIATITNPLLQPRVTLNVQTINSVNNIAQPIVRVLRALCNFNYDSFGFSSTVAIPYILEMLAGGILHIDGGRTFNSDQSITGDIGFVHVSSGGIVRGSITELIIMSQITRCDVLGEILLDFISVTNISQTTRNAIENAGQSIIHMQRLIAVYTQSVSYILNTNVMRCDIDAFQTQMSGCNIIHNQNQLQLKVGLLVASGSSNTCILSSGTIIGIDVGSIRLDGPGNTAIRIASNAIVNVGQILGNTNTGNTGVLVDDPGQIYGRIGRIIMQDQSCIEFRSSLASNLSFDWLLNGGNAYVIYVDGMGEVTMSGNAITAYSVKYPIYIAAMNSQFNLDLVRLDVDGACAAIVYINASGSKVNLDVQHFNARGAIDNGILVESGTLTIVGNYFLDSTNNAPLITMNNDSSLLSNLGFINTNDIALVANSTGDVWYSAERTITRNGSNNVEYGGTGNLTVSGYLSTPGNYNVLYNSVPQIARILNSTLVSGAANVISNAGFVNFVCNCGIGNAGLINTSSVPVTQFVTDGGVV